jgi:hypothetical protein
MSTTVAKIISNEFCKRNLVKTMPNIFYSCKLFILLIFGHIDNKPSSSKRLCRFFYAATLSNPRNRASSLQSFKDTAGTNPPSGFTLRTLESMSENNRRKDLPSTEALRVPSPVKSRMKVTFGHYYYIYGVRNVGA